MATLHAPQPPPTDVILTGINNEVTQQACYPPGCILILDDYHVIVAPPIHAAMKFLIEHLPPLPDGMQIVIASRVEPPFALARLRGRSQLTELRVIDLRFTRQEPACFLHSALGMGLSADNIAAL